MITEFEKVYLSHHGIKGQKWGVRRFQNPDGTWTDTGKKRYGKELTKSIKKQEAKINKEATAVKGRFDYGAAREKYNKNTFKAREELFNDPKYVKANKEYADAYQSHEHLMEDLFHKYKADLMWSEEDEKRFNDSAGRFEAAAKKQNDAFMSALKKHESALLSSKLKDLGQEDTEYGREFIKDYYTKKYKGLWYIF